MIRLCFYFLAVLSAVAIGVRFITGKELWPIVVLFFTQLLVAELAGKSQKSGGWEEE